MTDFLPIPLGKPADAIAYPPRFTHKQKQMVASNWLLNRELLKDVSVQLTTVGGKALKDAIKDGCILRDGTKYIVTWLDQPEACYQSPMVLVSFRSPKPSTHCLPYAVVKLPNEEQLNRFFEKLITELD
jgi:hypothetical protein